nr:hypothetical protein [uncultured Celeribacter sp.]
MPADLQEDPPQHIADVICRAGQRKEVEIVPFGKVLHTILRKNPPILPVVKLCDKTGAWPKNHNMP